MEADEQKKNGRPLKFQSVAELQQKIDEYFGECDPHVGMRHILKEKVDGSTYLAEQKFVTEQVPYTITGLALALNTTRDTLLDYESGKYDDPERSEGDNKTFSDTITRAKLRCQFFAEQHLFTGKQANGAIFSLKNNYHWVDRQIQELEGGFFDTPRRIEVEIVNPEPPSDPPEAETEPDAEPSSDVAS